jgi:hypothetical protein
MPERGSRRPDGFAERTMAARLVVVMFLSFVAISCADASSNETTGAKGGGEHDPAHAGVILAGPITFEVAIKDEARQRLEFQLARGSLDVVRLIIRNLRPRAAQPLKGVRIFIEKPDAGIRTPSGDPHFAGAFVLGLQAPESMLLNVAPTLSKLWQSGKLAPADLARRKALRVTFVPETWDSATALPKDFALAFESLTFEVPAKP